MRKKILIIGLGAAMGAARELLLARADQFAEKIVIAEAIRPKPTIPDTPIGAFAYPSHRKGKGEKKRAASQRFRKGWG